MDYSRLNINPPANSDQFLPLLADAWDNGISTVVSAGNNGKRTLGDYNPQRFGRADNPLITVGSIDAYGDKSSGNPAEGPRGIGTTDPFLTGSLTVFAQGAEVLLAKPYSSTLFQYGKGSSYAAPQVAGLAAYLAGVPGGGVSTAMGIKQKIVSLSRGNDAVDAPGLIYNGVRELFCSSTNARKSRREAKELSVRQKVKGKGSLPSEDQEIGLETIFANGQLQSSKYANFVSPSLALRCACFSVTNLGAWFSLHALRQRKDPVDSGLARMSRA